MPTGSPLPDSFRLQRAIFKDNRGTFSKILSSVGSDSLQLVPAEIFYSTSSTGVLRGMHLQVGQYMQNKVVSCLKGEILDVIVNLNPKSSDYKEPYAVLVNEASDFSILCPPGYAHGFLTLSSESVVQYIVDRPYSKDHDTGIRWDSFDYSWPILGKEPIISQRDKCLRHIDDFTLAL